MQSGNYIFIDSLFVLRPVATFLLESNINGHEFFKKKDWAAVSLCIGRTNDFSFFITGYYTHTINECNEILTAQGYKIEQMKNRNSVSFRAIFKRVKLFKYTYELSFSSKLLHTLRPEWPIWDKIVGVDHFHYRTPSSKRSDVDVVFTERYEQYADTFGKYLESSEGHMLIKNFDEDFRGTESVIQKRKILCCGKIE